MWSSQFSSASMLQFAAAYALILVVPGPVALTTGSRAAFCGLKQTTPLLAGICVGTGALTVSIAWGTVHLASSVPLSAVQAAGAVVLIWIAWQLLHSVPVTASDAPVPSARLWLESFAEGAALTFLSPQCASLFAAAFLGLFLGADNISTVVVVTMSMSLVWYTLIAFLFSHPVLRSAALQHHRAICRVAAAGLSLMALLSVFTVSM